jgi:hypothetical protein
VATMWKRFLKNAFNTNRLSRIICHHDWQYIPPNKVKRQCSKCNREQWIFQNRYPQIGEPLYEWRDMNFDELEHL